MLNGDSILGWSFSLSVRRCKDREVRSLSVCMNVTQIETFKPENSASTEQTASSEIFMTQKHLRKSSWWSCVWNGSNSVFLEHFQPRPEEETWPYWRGWTPELLTSPNIVSKELWFLNNSSSQSDKGPFNTQSHSSRRYRLWAGERGKPVDRWCQTEPVYFNSPYL